MRDAVIVEAVRTPVGRRKGGLAGVHPADLSAHVLRSLVERAGLDPAEVEDVIWGCVGQVGEQTFDIGRTAALAAGWPETVTGVTIDRQCGSSQQSIHFAAAGLVAGQYDVVVAGGVESMSRVPMGASLVDQDPFGEAFATRYGATPHQGVGAEMIAEKWGLSRRRCDEFAVTSHAKAAAARAEGRFQGEIAPVTLPDGTVLTEDEGIRPGTTTDVLAGLEPVFRPEGGVITAGNSSQISDGSAALLMTTSEKARELGLTRLARVHTAVLAGADPVMMLTAPIPATEKALRRSGLSLAEIGAFEVSEAFAPVTLPDGTVLTEDEGIRPGTTTDVLAGLEPVFRPEGGVITAGNSSQISDGSAALLMTTSEKARELGLTRLARVHTAVLAGADPVMMLTAPIPATEKALRRSGLSLAEIGAFEVSEAFAPVPLAWLADVGADAGCLNANGGAIALGHPLGASGARIATTLLHHMRDRGIRYGLQTMCEGGGQANATIFELI